MVGHHGFIHFVPFGSPELGILIQPPMQECGAGAIDPYDKDRTRDPLGPDRRM